MCFESRQSFIVFAYCALLSCQGSILSPKSRPTDSTHDVPTISDATDKSAGLPAQARVENAVRVSSQLFALISTGTEIQLWVTPSEGDAAWRRLEFSEFQNKKLTHIAPTPTTLLVAVRDESKALTQFFLLNPDTERLRETVSLAQPISALLFHDGAIFVATPSGLLFSKNENPFVHKDRAGFTLFAQPVHTLLAENESARLFAVGNSSAGMNRLHYSDDDGETWLADSVPGEVISAATGASNIYVQTVQNGAFRSENYGMTFKPMSVGGIATSFAADQNNALALVSGVVRYTIDAGLTWQVAPLPLPQGMTAEKTFMSGSTVIVSGSGQFVTAALK